MIIFNSMCFILATVCRWLYCMALLMSMFYIGGELAQSRLGLPKSLTGVFQGLLLFSLLACDSIWEPLRSAHGDYAEMYSAMLREAGAEAQAEVRIQRLWRACLSRAPQAEELAAAREFLAAAPPLPVAGAEDFGPWEQLAQAVLASSEFQFVD